MRRRVVDVDVAGEGPGGVNGDEGRAFESPGEEPETPAWQVVRGGGADVAPVVLSTPLPNMRRNSPEGLNFSTRWLAGSVT